MEIVLLLIVLLILLLNNNSLNSKLRNLEDKISDLSRKVTLLKTTEISKNSVETEIQKAVVKPVVPSENKIVFDTPKPIIEKVETKPIVEKTLPTPIIETIKPKFEPTPYIAKKSFWENFKEQNPDLEKFIGENLINKIGVLILVLGISYFVKFSIDKGWISEPARVGIGLLSGGLVMTIAHKLRQKYAAFSSVFVAGAIAIFYFTIAIAFHDYKLFGQTVAFAIMVVITAFSCLISLSYNRKELAVLSLIGGFAVPFMVSTGQGNYIALFTYIIILDLGILAIAYFKKWNIITILSYVFTVLLFGVWLFNDLYTKQPHYLGALVFGCAFYFIFILITIINNLRTKAIFSAVELTILTSNTFLFYSVGMVVLENFHPELKGLFTAILAVLNFGYAWFLYKKFGLDKTAVYLLIGLTLTFATLAIPVQFEGNYITLFWSAEAVLLLWLSQKSKIVSYKFASVIVSILMLISLVLDWLNNYNYDDNFSIVFNKTFITGAFSVASMVAGYYLIIKESETVTQFGITFNPILYRKLILKVALVIGYFVGYLEVSYQAEQNVYGTYSPFAITILYHLLFTGILFYFLTKTKEIFNIQVASVLAIISIILFTFWFSNTAFNEHTDFISSGVYQRIGFYLHFVSLAIVIYLFAETIKINKEYAVFTVSKSKAIPWIISFFIIYLASNELLLHSLVLTNSPVTTAQIQASKIDKDYAMYSLSQSQINAVRNQVIKTGFPILWGVLAFTFLIIGIKKQNKTLRIIALSLLGLTIAKLFLYDIRNASETGKIVAFILLGVLILIISFVYQKIKILVLDNEPTTTKTDENENL